MPSTLHSAAPLRSVLFAIGGGVHPEQRYGLSRAGSVDRNAGAVLPPTCGESATFAAK